MKILNRDSFQEVRSWIHQNARPLEMSLWNYLFEDGCQDAVIKELAYYQNADGGFAGWVEPDIWSTESSPYAAIIGIDILNQIGFLTSDRKEHPMIQGIFRYLESGVHTANEGWMFSIPSNDKYPRAPWWTYNEETNQVENRGITASLCAFILRWGSPASALFERATGYAHALMSIAETQEHFGETGATGMYQLLTAIKETGLTGTFPINGLDKKVTNVINQTIERDTEKWTNYTPRPSYFIKSPDSPLYQGNKEIMDTELDYLIATRPEGSVWDITWSWFDLGQNYAREFAISENWWKGIKAIEKIKLLSAFHRVSFH